MDEHSYLGNTDIKTLEKLYEQYKNNPDELDSSWINFFKGFDFAQTNYSHLSEGYDQEFKVFNLIEAYRKRGHLFTKTNPVRTRRKYTPTLAIENYGLTEEDLNKTFQGGKNIGIGTAPLKDIINHLEETYCRSIGAEYMFIRDPEKTDWLQEKTFLPKGRKDAYLFIS